MNMIRGFSKESWCSPEITYLQWSLQRKTAPSAVTRWSLVGVRSHIGVQNVLKILFGANEGRSHKTSRSYNRGSLVARTTVMTSDTWVTPADSSIDIHLTLIRKTILCHGTRIYYNVITWVMGVNAVL